MTSAGPVPAPSRDRIAEPGSAPPALLPVLCAAFLIFAQAFMVAPLIPQLAQAFHTSTGRAGLAGRPGVPHPVRPGDPDLGPALRPGRRRTVIVVSFALFTVLTAGTALASTATGFLAWRVVAAVGASGIVPISLALIGDLIPFNRRGPALGWLFGAMAGGIAVGSSAGAIAEPSIGVDGLFISVAAAAAVVVATAAALHAIPRFPRPAQRPPVRSVVRGYRALLTLPRGRRTYAYVAINAIVQSGVYLWLGLYLQHRFGLGPVGIGLALLGYGIPGFLLGPVIGRVADRRGRARLIPLGVAVSAGSASPWPCRCRSPSSPSSSRPFRSDTTSPSRSSAESLRTFPATAARRWA